MDSKIRWENIAILYDRLTPAAQEQLIERFVERDPDRLVQLTSLRARVKTRRHESGTGR